MLASKAMRPMLSKQNLKKLLKKYYPLLAILIGIALVSMAMGPYLTLDTDLEFSTAQGILRWGYPYINAWGNLFNEPPLGFYTEAAFFQVFGFSVVNGVALITLFGLTCTVVVYKLGKELYDETTGLFGAAFFALAPWELVLSRSFLIDVQCLLFSLIYFYFGILAIRKDSVKLAGFAGIFFAAALLTKLFAVFMLLPLLLLYLIHRPLNKKQIISQLGAFSLPALLSSLFWYQIIMKKGFFYLIQHNDFQDLNFPNVPVSYMFVPNFLINDGLGVFFVATILFSLAVGLLFWKRLSKQTVISDVICITTIISILGLVMYLAVNLNLKAPYNSAVKYIYQSLPFFSLVAASLVKKIVLLLKSEKQSMRAKRAFLWIVSFIGLFLVASALVANMVTARELASASYLIFRVQPNVDFGYAFHVDSPISQDSILFTFQFIGFLLLLSGLLWIGRKYIENLFISMYRRLVTSPQP